MSGEGESLRSVRRISCDGGRADDVGAPGSGFSYNLTHHGNTGSTHQVDRPLSEFSHK